MAVVTDAPRTTQGHNRKRQEERRTHLFAKDVLEAVEDKVGLESQLEPALLAREAPLRPQIDRSAVHVISHIHTGLSENEMQSLRDHTQAHRVFAQVHRARRRCPLHCASVSHARTHSR